MSDREQAAAREVLDSLRQIPPDGADYIRGYVQGRLDGVTKKENK